MARIRTIKPAFFRHEALYEAERETQLPLRLAFAGLWTVADREGRFVWRPRALKLDVLPYDDVDFSRVLHALTTRGFIVRYTDGREEYGAIPSWRRHQVVNHRETASELPDIQDCQIVTDASATREARDTGVPVHAPGEGEGKGTGREQEGNRKGKGKHPSAPALRERPKQGEPESSKPTAAIWTAYATGYRQRYGVDPTRNAKVNGQLAHLIARLGAEEAPAVAGWYPGHNAALYVRSGHCVDLLLRDCEKLRTEWATGRQVTHGDARLTDNTQTTANVWGPIIDEAREAERLKLLALEGGNGH